MFVGRVSVLGQSLLLLLLHKKSLEVCHHLFPDSVSPVCRGDSGSGRLGVQLVGGGRGAGQNWNFRNIKY